MQRIGTRVRKEALQARLAVFCSSNQSTWKHRTLKLMEVGNSIYTAHFCTNLSRYGMRPKYNKIWMISPPKRQTMWLVE